MTVTPASFRTDLPEFADTVAYPDSLIAFYITFAGNMLQSARWGNVLDQGTEMFVAHHCVIERLSSAAAGNGLPPGMSKGPIASQSADKVSVSYATADSIELDAGHWNETIYGKRFIRMARMMGSGPLQIGGGGTVDPLSGGNAWQGPWPWNSPNPSG